MFCGRFGFGGFGGGFGRGFGGFNSSFILISMGIRLVILAAIIFIIVKLFKKYNNSSNSALKILDEKFANGEISEDEYLKRKTIISGKK
ncbi:MAG: hypothetical protein K0R54_415 [Clostridiaceae bacterium]|jgi:putative membrane protein|nr:hypothetical protein [Clostridiaceae bacterium]